MEQMGAGVVATEPVRVDVRSVEKELSSIWRRAIEGNIPGVTAPLARTILSNLLVYATSESQAMEASEVVAELMAEHPSRAVIADAQPGEPGHELEADVSMLCSISERGRRLCGEQVRLHAHGVNVTALGTIMPVLVPDLPIYLWTPGDLTEDEVLPELTHISDHWIIDSRSFKEWTDRFKRVITLGPHHEPPIMLHDIAWVSLGVWREVVAEHFDPKPARQYLRGINRVEIRYQPARDSVPNIQSVLMAAWLISRLGWQAPRVQSVDESGWTITASAEGRDVTIRMRPQADAPMPVVGVIIESELQDKRGVFSAVQADHPEEIWAEADAPDIPKIRRTASVAPGSLSDDISNILDDPGSDKLYEQALPALQGLILEIEGRV